jgi:hypothetical protein
MLHTTGVDVPFGLSYIELEDYITDKAISMGMLNQNNQVRIKTISVQDEDKYLVIETEIMESLLN